jgi:hypothetical protein
MTSFSLETLGEKLMISFGVILLIGDFADGTLNLSSFSLEYFYLYFNRDTVDNK